MKCRDCPTEIAWTKTRAGKNMPVDADSLTEEDVETIRAGEELPYRHGEHVSHFETCPAAAKFRKPR